jgi:hypothetical protein
VLPANQLAITGMTLCHKKVGDACVSVTTFSSQILPVIHLLRGTVSPKDGNKQERKLNTGIRNWLLNFIKYLQYQTLNHVEPYLNLLTLSFLCTLFVRTAQNNDKWKLFESGLSNRTMGASVYISEYWRTCDKNFFVQLVPTFHCLSSIFKLVIGLGDIYHIAQLNDI